MTARLIRPSVDEVLIHQAYAWAGRGTCARARVGAVLAIDGRTISSGYNGAPAGMEHCTCKPIDPLMGTDDALEFGAGCPMSVHAEANAVAFAARYGIATEGSTLYTTLTPCKPCAALLINAGVVRVVAVDRYRLDAGERLLRAAGIPISFADEL